MADADGVLFVTCMPLDAAGLVSNRSPYRPPSSSDIHVVLVVCILISASQSSCIASFAQFAVVRSLYEYSRRIIDQNRTDWMLFGVWCLVVEVPGSQVVLPLLISPYNLKPSSSHHFNY
jgi:hypothetical protein